MLTPKYSAAIIVDDQSIKVFFARPADEDVLQSVKALGQYEGMRVVNAVENAGLPLRICCSPVYDANDVAEEVKRILQAHGLENIRMECGGSKREKASESSES